MTGYLEGVLSLTEASTTFSDLTLENGSSPQLKNMLKAREINNNFFILNFFSKLTKKFVVSNPIILLLVFYFFLNLCKSYPKLHL